MALLTRTLIFRYLAGNKLHCTCAIKWFVTYLNVNPILFNGTLASCSSPTTVEQKKVALLNTSNLQCGENYTRYAKRISKRHDDKHDNNKPI